MHGVRYLPHFLILLCSSDHSAEGMRIPVDVLTALRDAARETWQDFDV